MKEISNISLVMVGDKWAAIKCRCGEDFLIVGIDKNDPTECRCGRKYFCKIEVTIYEVEEA